MNRILIALLGWRSSASMLARGKSHTLLDVPRPFPRKLLGAPVRTGGFGLGPWAIVAQAGVPCRRRVYWAFPFVRIGRWREWYFPALLVVWRKDERASITFWPWIHLRNWLFTRCEGCGKRLGYGHSPVARLEHEHQPRTKSIMVGRTGCYHWGCAPDPEADRRATQSWDRQWGHDIGLRQTVLNEPTEVAVELAALNRLAHERAMRAKSFTIDVQMGPEVER